MVSNASAKKGVRVTQRSSSATAIVLWIFGLALGQALDAGTCSVEISFRNTSLPENALICLAMIVKDGGEPLRLVLEAAKDAVDLWVIVDTGSRDGSQGVVRAIMSSKTGKLIQTPFEDFSTARNVAMEAAETLCPRCFVVMLDDSFVMRQGLKLREALVHQQNSSAFLLQIRDQTSTYYSCRVFRADKKIRYVRRVHEYPECDCGHIISDVYVEDLPSPIMAQRSRARWQKDKEVLMSELNDAINGRSLFYLAQTLEDLGEKEESLKAYVDRANMEEGFLEERAVAFKKAGLLCLELGLPFLKCAAYFWSAVMTCPHRTDPLYYIAKHFFDIGDFASCFWIGQYAWKRGDTRHDVLFVPGRIYQVLLPDLIASCAVFVSGQHEEGRQAALEAYRSEPTNERLRNNLEWFEKNF